MIVVTGATGNVGGTRMRPTRSHWVVDSWLGMFEDVGTGAMAEVSDTIERVGGHTPTTARDCVTRHRAEFLARREG